MKIRYYLVNGTNTVRIKHMLHQFPAVYVNLDIDGKPCLYFYKHETVLFIQVKEIVVKAFGIHGFHDKFSKKVLHAKLSQKLLT